ncbi:alkaline phosphatase D family protein [Sphingobium sp. EM0848]|uniref:alkaline phosphatase D family protein n=1 Tax=Sphingobium sp. EM0848 TaxID=2743473 RepID=UPI00159C18A7|nr:alkaline phosphatase D family protein [Sphingobium sp. EM0848]
MPVRRAQLPGPQGVTAYRPARARLIDSIRRHQLSNVVIASGDFHRNFVGTVPEREDAPDGKQAAIEFLATSITSNGNGAPLSEVERDLSDNPQRKCMKHKME